MKYRESLISAHHNYLVNEMLSPGFALGDLFRDEGFWFLADVVPPGETTPHISGRIYEDEGLFLAEIGSGNLVQNPGGCVLQPVAGGFRLHSRAGGPLLSVQTQVFTNGYLTRIQGKLHDETGALRMEPSYEGVKVHGKARLALEGPLR